MPGSSSSVTVCNTVLNAIMAESLSSIANRLEGSKNFYEDLKRVIVDLYKEHSRIIYNGNSYTEEWEKEAKKRKLKNIKKAPEAFKAFIKADSIKMFEEFNVYRKEELISRYNIKLGKYIKSVETEARVMKEIASQDVMPEVIRYINFMQDSINNVKKVSFLSKKLNNTIKLAEDLNDEIEDLDKEISKLESIEDTEKKAKFASDKLKDKMDELRNTVDTLEEILPSNYWPMPTYEEILN